MDARVLQRFRRKLQRGERLSEAEMRRVRPRADVLALAGVREHGGLRATWTDEQTSPGAREILALVLPVLAEAAEPGILFREGPAGLVVTYLVDGVALLPRSAPATLEAVDRAAWKHLEEGPVEPRAVIVDRGQPRLAPESLGLWALCEADGADGARLLTASQRQRLFDTVGAGPYRVSLVRRELALVAPLLDPTAVSLLEALAPGPGGIEGRFVFHPDGALERLAA